MDTWLWFVICYIIYIRILESKLVSNFAGQNLPHIYLTTMAKDTLSNVLTLSKMRRAFGG